MPGPDVRYAVIVLDPGTGTRVAAVVPWPGRVVDATGCLDTISGTFGPSVAATVVILPVERIPLTEQGKPNRPEIRLLGRDRADYRPGHRPPSCHNTNHDDHR